ncbi:hypothetical protein LCGC14_2116260 [marine sediment metagenome]|uniref:Uncharacterized protein n=1 Tax=marine sediment metagenome TaxID=412755 RepID=A0A0F9GIQ9_9ZZZZ
MKINKTVYGWEFVNVTKTEVNVIKQLFKSGIFDSIISNIDIKEWIKEMYNVKCENIK